MRQILISKNTLPFPTISLRNYFEKIADSNQFKYIEETEDITDSVFVIEYQDFIDHNQNENIKKICCGAGNIFIRHDFGVNVTELSSKIYKIVHEYEYSPKQISIQLALNSDKIKLTEKFQELNLLGIEIFIYEIYMDRVYKDYKDNLAQLDSIKPNSKFSIFSRRYNEDRFLLYLELLKRNLLQNFNYTFSNGHAEIKPYPYTLVEIEDVLKFAKDHNYDENHISQWINGLPYTDLKTFQNPFDQSIYKLMMQSYINVVIETASIPNTFVNLILTEKVYKPIILKKPFYLFGAPQALNLLKAEGFKTFEPFFNESYADINKFPDSFTYYKTKINLLCNDIERINNLDTTSFLDLMHEVNFIADYNFNHFLQIAENKLQDISRLFEYLQLKENGQ